MLQMFNIPEFIFLLGSPKMQSSDFCVSGSFLIVLLVINNLEVNFLQTKTGIPTGCYKMAAIPGSSALNKKKSHHMQTY